MKKICLIIAFVMIFVSLASIGASAENVNDPDFPCGGVIEMVDVDILYVPLKSYLTGDNIEDKLTGAKVRITYPDGDSEIYTIEKIGNRYYAGDFSVRVGFEGLEAGKIITYGLVTKSVDFYREIVNRVGYSGETDFVFLYLPSFSDILYLIDAYVRMIF